MIRHDTLAPLIPMTATPKDYRLSREIAAGAPIRWGVWGPGAITHKFAKGMAVVDDGTFVAVGSRTLAHAEAWAAQYDVPRAYGSIEDLAADTEVDIVYVASPMSAHYEDCKTLLTHGRSVLCEKSVTLNSTELWDLIELAKANGCFFMEAMWSSFVPSTREALKQMHDGAIGDITFMRASFNVGTKPDPSSRLFDPALGGGAFLDLGIYPLAATLTFMGDQITGLKTSAYIGETGVDYDFDLILDYGDRHAYIAAGTSQPEPLVFNLVGTQGRIVLTDPFISTEDVHIAQADGTVTDEQHLPFDANGYEYEIRECHTRLRAGELWSPHWSWQHSLTAMTIIDSCRRQWGMLYPGELPTALGNYLQIPRV